MNINRFLPLTILISGLAMAQPFGPPGQHSMERIEHLKKVRLMEMLDLKEEQSVRFFSRLKDHEDAMKAIMHDKMDLLDRLDKLVGSEADTKDMEKLFPEVLAVDDRMAKERAKFFNGLSDILSVQERAKYLLFERQFERELRDAMREVRQRREHRGEE